MGSEKSFRGNLGGHKINQKATQSLQYERQPEIKWGRGGEYPELLQIATLLVFSLNSLVPFARHLGDSLWGIQSSVPVLSSLFSISVSFLTFLTFLYYHLYLFFFFPLFMYFSFFMTQERSNYTEML